MKGSDVASARLRSELSEVADCEQRHFRSWLNSWSDWYPSSIEAYREHEHDARLSEPPAFQAPAEMPGEEEIARVIYPYGFKLMDGSELLASSEASRYRQAHESARAILALFAPILAERASLRETIRSNSVWDFPRDLQNLTVKLEALEARALAAEAALAEIAGRDEVEIALDPDWPRRIAAAAIRAQAE